MQLHPPTPSTFHVAVAGAAVVAVGVAAHAPAAVAFGGAMILAVAIGRAAALATVTRLRTAGFEMVWTAPKRVARTSRGGVVQLEAELRNRGSSDARGVNVRAVASSQLEVDRRAADRSTSPRGGQSTPRRHRPGEAHRTVGASRDGARSARLAGRRRRAPTKFSMFAEPPRSRCAPAGAPRDDRLGPRRLIAANGRRGAGRGARRRGGRTPRAARARPGRRLQADRLEGERPPAKAHRPGDGARRTGRGVAPSRRQRRALGRRGGESPARPRRRRDRRPRPRRHLARGDHVGLIVTASRMRSWIPPAVGGAHAMRIAAALASAASTVDGDRCELDEHEIAQRVAEHARPLDPRGLADLTKGDLDQLAMRAESLRARAPFAPRLPFARTSRDQHLRHYLAAFGIEVPPRTEGGAREERRRDCRSARQAVERARVRPSLIYVWAPVPLRDVGMGRAIRKLKRRHAEVRWTLPPFEASVGTQETGVAPKTVAQAVEAAVRKRARRRAACGGGRAPQARRPPAAASGACSRGSCRRPRRASPSRPRETSRSQRGAGR